MRRLYSSLGRFDVRFRYLIVAFWVVVTVVCVRTLPGLGSVAKDTESGFLPANSPSMHAAQLLDPFENSTLATATLVASRGGTGLTAQDQTAISALLAKVKALPNVVSVRALGTSSDGEALQALVQANVPQYGGGAGTTLVDAIRADFTGVGAPAGLQFNLTGQLAIASDADTASAHSQNTTQLLSVLFIIVLLLFAFRALLAPLVTLLPAGLVLALAGPVIAAASHIGVQVSIITELILVVLVLGAGTDYGLFLVFRVREEIRRGLAPRDAVVRSVETVGESITFSALIVIGALLSLVIAQFGFYQGLGPALAIGIGLMLLAGLTLLPALLAILGRAVFWPSNLTVRETPQVGFWGRVAAAFVHRPLVTAIAGVGIFAALAMGSLGTTTAGFADEAAGPSGSDSAIGQAVLNQHFPSAGTITSTEVVMRFPTSVFDNPTALVAAQDRLEMSPGFKSVIGPLDPDGPTGVTLTAAQITALHQQLGWPFTPGAAATVTPAVAQEYGALVSFISADARTVVFAVIPTIGPAGSAVASANIPALRADTTTAATGAGASDSGIFSLDAFAYDVENISQNDLMHIIPTVAIIIAILLAIVLRSATASLFLVPSVVLSYLAALGLVGLVFVHFGGQSGVQFIMPFLMFVFLMALGSDYNVLVMTRIREEAHRLPLRQAVRTAIGVTGTTVTTAGLVLGGTFAVLGFASGGTPQSGEVQQVGFGIAAGILMDTFFVRTIMVPAAVVLVGRWTWWPSRLFHRRADFAVADETAA
ncbi:MAG: MMPL family transporter [Candidatus Dormibacteria bacterium]|jgi:RND superfamily putative drug exporter